MEEKKNLRDQTVAEAWEEYSQVCEGANALAIWNSSYSEYETEEEEDLAWSELQARCRQIKADAASKFEAARRAAEAE